MKTALSLLLLPILVLSAACGDNDEVSSEAEARAAYMGLHECIGLAMDLGFDGFNAASSANIPAQSGTGEVSGTLTVSGQVDQGASNNKEMRLNLDLVEYADPAPLEKLKPIVYDTADPFPLLSLSLKNIPTGTLTGTLTGIFAMTGGLSGQVALDLAMAGELEPVPEDQTKVQRKPETTTVTGTATSRYGTYQVNLQL